MENEYTGASDAIKVSRRVAVACVRPGCIDARSIHSQTSVAAILPKAFVVV